MERWFGQAKDQFIRRGAHTIWHWPLKIMSEVPDLADEITENII